MTALAGFAAASSAAGESAPIRWYYDYAEAMQMARLEQRMLFIYFEPEKPDSASRRNETKSLSSDSVKRQLQGYVALRIPVDAEIPVDGKPLKVLKHDAFAELRESPGLAILDFANPNMPNYGRVVSVVPMHGRGAYQFQPRHLSVLLDLPPGSLTQRTMIFAVRIHPEQPRSTTGEFDSTLAVEAESHSRHQARIRMQGHHNWGGRFGRILSRLPFGLRAQEVVAESWPQESLVDACVDCVDSWRHSSGHWSAVRGRQQRFGYDIQRGSNGIWYATGIFGN